MLHRRSDRREAWAASPLVVLMLVACASPRDSAVFVTKTSMSIADIDSLPASISIGYDRVEGYAGPRFTEGSAYPVASLIETNGGITDRKIRQVFVGGEAALIATSATAASAPSPAASVSASAASNARALIFATGTTTGLKLGFTEGTIAPTSFTIGYRRKEAALVPVDQQKLGTSVLGSLSNDVGVAIAASAPAASNPTSAVNVAFGLEQFFATGKAAENLAGRKKIRDKFQDSAETAVGNVQKYREAEAVQGRIAMETIVCVDRLNETQFDRVINNIEDLRILADYNVMPKIRAASRKDQRQLYYSFLTVLNPSSPKVTSAMEFHKQLACDLAPPAP